jgi:hypothetical protein
MPCPYLGIAGHTAGRVPPDAYCVLRDVERAV